ncbi:hypothetical protein ACMXYX_04695 [Neptuniibacter sp. QD72_48]|uniref:hypothetical protein n=1 Tax=unclassified Neptuniibacter TaxID=2630693 RepID=UPI0039F4F1C1
MRFEYDYVNRASASSPIKAVFNGFILCLLGMVFSVAAGEDSNFFNFLTIICVASGAWLIFTAKKRNVKYLIKESSAGIEDISGGQSYVMAFVGFFVMLGFGVVPIFIELNIRTTDKMHYIFWVFSLVGFFFCKYGFKKINEYKEIGKSTLFLEDGCGRIGDRIAGHFKIQGIPTPKPLTLSLSCNEIYRVEANEKLGFKESNLFKESIDPQVKSDFQGCSEVFFDLPISKDLEPSFAKSRNGIAHWYIKLEGEFTALSGRTVDVKRIWKVPVTL